MSYVIPLQSQPGKAVVFVPVGEPIVEQPAAPKVTPATTADGFFRVDGFGTSLGYSDRHAGFVTSITNNGKRLSFSEGKATLLNGPDSGQPDALVFHAGGFVGHTSGTQRWKIEIDPTAPHTVYTLRKNGRWIRAGESLQNGRRLIPGHSHHYDYNF